MKTFQGTTKKLPKNYRLVKGMKRGDLVARQDLLKMFLQKKNES